MAVKYSFAQLREKSGLSCQDVAQKTGDTLRTVYKWENNEAKPRKSVMNQLSYLAKTTHKPHTSSNSTFTFIDLFAGIGGMRMGFEWG